MFNYVNGSYITPERLFLIFSFFYLSPHITYYLYFSLFLFFVVYFL